MGGYAIKNDVENLIIHLKIQSFSELNTFVNVLDHSSTTMK